MKTVRAKDVMSEKVLTLQDDTPMTKAAIFLTEHQISGAPVVDSAGTLVGVVSLTDIARTIEERAARPRAVRDAAAETLTVHRIMTPVADTVSEETPISQVARLMLDNHYHRLVVTRYEKPVGIISAMDLVALLADDR